MVSAVPKVLMPPPSPAAWLSRIVVLLIDRLPEIATMAPPSPAVLPLASVRLSRATSVLAPDWLKMRVVFPPEIVTSALRSPLMSPVMVTSLVRVSSEVSVICPATVNVMLSASALALAKVSAARSEPAPASFRFVTMKLAMARGLRM